MEDNIKTYFKLIFLVRMGEAWVLKLCQNWVQWCIFYWLR